jgi:hypothetical protein
MTFQNIDLSSWDTLPTVSVSSELENNINILLRWFPYEKAGSVITPNIPDDTMLWVTVEIFIFIYCNSYEYCCYLLQTFQLYALKPILTM